VIARIETTTEPLAGPLLAGQRQLDRIVRCT